MEQITPGLAGGASVVLLTLLLSALFRFLQLMRRRDADAMWENSELRADLQWERQLNSMLIREVQQAGVGVPPIVWAQRPPSPERQKRKKDDDE